MFSKSLKYFMGFGRGFSELHTKLDADTLLDYVIHRQQNKTQSRKSTCAKTMHVHNTVSLGRLMQLVLQKCDLGLPSHLSLVQLQH
jgi:hypothetical protein